MKFMLSFFSRKKLKAIFYIYLSKENMRPKGHIAHLNNNSFIFFKFFEYEINKIAKLTKILILRVENT